MIEIRTKGYKKAKTADNLHEPHQQIDESTLIGKIVDEAGQPLIGATVMIQNTTTGTLADMDGHFQLKLPEDCATLTFHYAGYETKVVEKACGGRKMKMVLTKKGQAEGRSMTGPASPTSDRPWVVTGRVFNKDKQPLIGANVLIKGTPTGTITDLEGNFRLKLPTSCATLQFSYTGLETAEIKDVCSGQSLKLAMDKETGDNKIEVAPAGVETSGASQLFSGFKAFPNPASDQVTINFVLKEDARVRLGVYSLDGKLIQTIADKSLPSGMQQFVWDTTDQGQKGLFLVQLKIGEEVFNQQIVIE